MSATVTSPVKMKGFKRLVTVSFRCVNSGVMVYRTYKTKKRYTTVANDGLLTLVESDSPDGPWTPAKRVKDKD